MEDLEESFHQIADVRNYLRRDLNQVVEQLRKSEEMTWIEKDKKDQAYVDLKVVSSNLKAHNKKLDKAWHQNDEWKDIWLNSTKAQRK